MFPPVDVPHVLDNFTSQYNGIMVECVIPARVV